MGLAGSVHHAPAYRTRPIRFADKVAKGFEREAFEDAWSRYLVTETPEEET